jgi:hypothetical protein
MAFAWVAISAATSPPLHDVATLDWAKLPVRAAVDRPIRSATGVHCSAIRLTRSTAVSRGRDGLGRRPSTTLRTRVVWMKGSLAQPDGLRPSHAQPARRPDLTEPALLTGSPGDNASSPAVAVLAPVEPAERHEFSRREISVEGRPGCTDSTAAEPEPAPRRSTGASHAQLGVRRPLVGRMPADRREQAISAIAYLLIVRREREAQRPPVDA